MRSSHVLGALPAALAIAVLQADAAGAACRPLPATDGLQPPCGPALADSPWPIAHGGMWMQDSSPLRGPVRSDAPRAHRVALGGAAIGTLFSPRYRDGRRVAWALGGTLDYRGYVWKLDGRTGREIGRVAVDKPGAPPSPLSGVYGFLSADNELHLSRGRELVVFGDGRQGDRTSAPTVRRRQRFPAKVFCRTSDEAVGMVTTQDGRLAVVTRLGNVALLPIGRRMRSQDAVVGRLNGARCDDPAVPEEQLEQVSNSIAADSSGHLYPLTDHAMYRLDERDGRLRVAWRVEYGRSEAGGARLDAGSGSTPTLMGTRAADDRFVVIVDGSAVMRLVLVWRDRIPKDWQPIAPGRSRRIACEVPVDFGDPAAAATSSEQSVVVRGYASYVPNNTLRGTAPEGADEFERLLDAALAGGDPNRAPLGVERIDWDPRTRTCTTVWANPSVSLPNGVPAFSSGSRTLYGIGQRGGVWGLEGMDAATGRSTLWVPSSSVPTENSLFSGLAIGEGRSMWTGSLGGITVYRPR